MLHARSVLSPGKSQRIEQRSSLFRGFLNKIREDSVKISGRAEENEAARAAEGCTERKKGHERSMRVLSLCVSGLI